MKDKWYGDHRDVIKWGSVVHLAKREHIPNIIQIAFLRKESPPKLLVDGSDVPIPDEVWAHFRDIKLIRFLAEEAQLGIYVFDDEFEHKGRSDYVCRAVDLIKKRKHPQIVLLDPDTGIEPQTAKAQHVTMRDIECFWEALEKGDWLVLYQHGPRAGDTNWVGERKKKFQEACGTNRATTMNGPDIAKDVAFFAIQKKKVSCR